MAHRPQAIIDADGQLDLSRANAYGRLLAALSGIEAGEGQSTDQVLAALAGQLDASAGRLSASALLDLVGGARLVAQTHPAARDLFRQIGQTLGLNAAQLDGIDSAWNTLLALADGSDNNGAALSAAQFQALGIVGLDDTAKRDALNDVLDVQTNAAVRSRSKVQALADTVKVVLATAAGSSSLPSQAQLEELGLTQLNPGRTAELIRRIASSPDDGSAVDTLAELQALVDITPPDTTISDIGLSQSSGSHTPLLTRTAPQNVTGRLSAPLAADERLLVSLDGGTRWVDISASVSGTRVAHTLTLNDLGRILLKVQDLAGNDAAVLDQPYLLDTLPPQLQITQSNDQIAGDGVINATERIAGVVLSGTTEANRGVSIATGAGSSITATADGTGAWSATVPTANLPSGGSVTFTVTSSDAAGNTATATRTAVVDTTAPSLSVTQSNDQIAVDGIINAAERIAGVVLSGMTEANRSVSIATGTGADVTATADDIGAWNATVPAAKLPTSGNVSFTVTSSDAAGNTATATRTAVVDTTAPTLEIDAIAGDDVIGASERTQAITVEGSTDAQDGQIVTVTWDGSSRQAEVVQSRWSVSFEPEDLPEPGDYEVTASVTDGAGNAAPTASRGLSLQAPEPPVVLFLDFDPILGDDQISAIEKNFGVTVSGTTNAPDGSQVQLRWAEGEPQLATVLGGAWSVNVSSQDLPTDGEHRLSAWIGDLPHPEVLNTRTATVDTRTPEARLRLSDYAVLTGGTASGSSPPEFIGLGNSGELLVSWVVEYDLNREIIMAQRLNAAAAPIDEPFALSEPHDGNIENLGLVSLDGGVVMTWGTSYSEQEPARVFVRYIDSAHPANSFDPVALLAPGTTHAFNAHAAALGPDGGFVVAWDALFFEEDPGLGSYRVFMQRFDAGGQALEQGPVMLARPAFADGTQEEPRIATLGQAGDFVLVWRAGEQDDWSLCAQRFDSQGQPVWSDPLLIEPDNFDWLDEEHARILPVGNAGAFVVVYESYDSDADGSRAFAHYVSDAGEVSEAVALEAQGLEGASAWAPEVVAATVDGDDGFIVTWVAALEGGPEEVCVQRFAVNAGALSPKAALRLPTLTQHSEVWNPNPTVWGDAGDFWVSWSTWDGVAERVYLQGFAATGLPVGGPTRLDNPQASEDHAYSPRMSTLDSGDLAVTWIGDDGQGNVDVFVQRLPGSQPQGEGVQFSSSADGIEPAPWLSQGERLRVTLAFDEPVEVTGLPRLVLEVGGEEVLAEYESGSGSNALVFGYTILPDQSDLDGVAMGALSLNGGLISDAAGNIAVLPDTGAVQLNTGYRVDTQTPTAWAGVQEPAMLVFDDFEGPMPLMGGAASIVASQGDALILALVHEFISTELIFTVVQPDGNLPMWLAAGPSPQSLEAETLMAMDAWLDTAWLNEASPDPAQEPAPPTLAAVWRAQSDAGDAIFLTLPGSGSPEGLALTSMPAGQGWLSAPQIEALGNEGKFVVTWTRGVPATPGDVESFEVSTGYALLLDLEDMLQDDAVLPAALELASGPTPNGLVNLPFNQDAGSNLVRVTPVGTQGAFAAAWVGLDMDDGDTSIYLQLSQANGDPVGETLRIEAPGVAEGRDHRPQLLSLGQADFALAWAGERDDGDLAYFVQYLCIDEDTGLLTAGALTELDHPSPSPNLDLGHPLPVQMSALGEAGFVVSWTAQLDFGLGVFAQRFDPVGNAIGETVQLQSPQGYEGFDLMPKVVALGSEGAFAVAWQDWASNIYVQRFQANGEQAGPASRLDLWDEYGDTWASNVQIAAVGGEGAYAVSWTQRIAGFEFEEFSPGAVFIQHLNADGSTSRDVSVELGDDARIASSEAGTAYLVRDSVATSQLSNLSAVDDALWNSTPVLAGYRTIDLSTQGLELGDYKLYTVDASGLWSAASQHTVTVVANTTAPEVWLEGGALYPEDQAWFESTEKGTAVLIHTGLIDALAEPNDPANGPSAVLTAANAGRWNSVTVGRRDWETEMPLTGLEPGQYVLYLQDRGGLWSLPSENTVTVNRAPLRLADLTAVEGVEIVGAAIGDASGTAVSSAGDFNGDGFDDLIIGSPERASGGVVHIVLGRASLESLGLDDTPEDLGGRALVGGGAQAGLSVAAAGDVNGDGLADIIVGAPAGNEDSGRSYVVFGRSGTGTITLSALGNGGFIIEGASAGDRSGWGVGGGGDLNGDGLDDLLIGAPATAHGQAPGTTYVVFGRTDSATVQLAQDMGTSGLFINGIDTGGFAGRSVAVAGDVNGDGWADLIFGAPYSGGAGNDSGAAVVVFGGPQLTSVQASDLGSHGFWIVGAAGGDSSGEYVAGAGDVNGDGLADLAIGVWDREAATESYVVFGRSDTTPVQLSELGAQGFAITADSHWGWSNTRLAPAGDINGDGLADLIMGARLSDDERGVSYVVFGRSQSTNVSLSEISAGSGGFVIWGETSGAQSGAYVNTAGDVDGDGLADLIIGAPGIIDFDAGRSHLVFGSAAGAYAQVSIDELGGSGDDAFSDGGTAKTLVGGAGNDSLTATAASVLYGGIGNDLFLIGQAMSAALQSPMGSGGNVDRLARIDGGGGIDTLALSGSGLVLDLTQVANPAAGAPHGGSRLSSIEIIDLTGSGHNTLRLAARDVLDLADFNAIDPAGSGANRHQLLVDGNSGDRVVLLESDWSHAGQQTVMNDQTYQVWNHDQTLVTLYLAENVIPYSVTGEPLLMLA